MGGTAALSCTIAGPLKSNAERTSQSDEPRQRAPKPRNHDAVLVARSSCYAALRDRMRAERQACTPCPRLFFLADLVRAWLPPLFRFGRNLVGARARSTADAMRLWARWDAGGRHPPPLGGDDRRALPRPGLFPYGFPPAPFKTCALTVRTPRGDPLQCRLAEAAYPRT